MPVGIAIDGRNRVDDEQLCLTESGTVTLAAGSSASSASVTVSGSQSNPPFFAFRCRSGETRAGYRYAGNNTFEFSISSTAPAGTQVEFWVFREPVSIPPVSFGIQVRDDAGKILWNTGSLPFRVVGVAGLSPPSEPTGRKYACALTSTFSAYFVLIDVTNYPLGGETGGANPTISLASSLSQSGTEATFTFPSITASVSGGTATDIVWTIEEGSGDWSVPSGQQGSLTCTPVVNTSALGTYTATLTVDAIVGGFPVSDSMVLSYTREAPAIAVTLDPPDQSLIEDKNYHIARVDAIVTGGTATSYVWEIVSTLNGEAALWNGTGKPYQEFWLDPNDGNTAPPVEITAKCVVTVDGVDYTRFAEMSFGRNASTDPDPDPTRARLERRCSVPRWRKA